MTATEYARVTFRQRTYIGRRSHEGIGAKNGVRLTRVTDGGRDDLRITGLVPETWEVPWSNVASGVPRSVVEPGEPEPTDLEPEVESKPALARAKKAKR